MGHLKHNGADLLHNINDHLIDECAACPEDASGCPSTLYTDVTSTCEGQFSGDCSGKYYWNYDSGSLWAADWNNSVCQNNDLLCDEDTGRWETAAPNGSDYTCVYSREAQGEDDCPTGTYSLDSEGCYTGSCDQEITIDS
jgi:hypothetical protein